MDQNALEAWQTDGRSREPVPESDGRTEPGGQGLLF
jgi:hypothetical protein